MADIVLVNPRFEVSFWGLEHALPILGKRATMPPASLPLLAALTPVEHRVTLVDENAEPLDFDRLARADLVGVTGMNVQRVRMRELLGELKRRGIFTVVGGPWVTVQEQWFEGLCDVRFVGEADETWPRFLEEWEQGSHRSRYEQPEPTDLARLPVPRFDLLEMRHYMFGSLQFSRGCPFQCEFCDIIVTFGRRPRLKESGQLISELEALRRQGVESAFVVDDNLIGNRAAARAMLRDVAAWQRANGYPLGLFAQATVNLADDGELLRLLEEANFHTVFLGVESPNDASLKEAKKTQNLASGESLIERIHRIQAAGLEVWAGMIVGFDHDDASIFAAQREFLREARIAHAMVGLLSAIPKTPLYSRLEREGRLDPSGELENGTNVVPRGMSRSQLRDGYRRLMCELHEPEAYFDRFDALYRRGGFRFGRSRDRDWRTRHRWLGLKARARTLARCVGLYWRLMRRIPAPRLRREYRRRTWRLLAARPDLAVLFVFLVKCAVHWHHYTMSRRMGQGGSPLRSTIGPWTRTAAPTRAGRQASRSAAGV